MAKSPHSPILQGLKLDGFYRCPFIYDTTLEICYPPLIYRMKPIFEHQSDNVRVLPAGKSSTAGSLADTFMASAQLPLQEPAALASRGKSKKPRNYAEDVTSVEQLMAKQSRTLTKLKDLRRQVDQLETGMRKSESNDQGAAVSPIHSTVPVVENTSSPSEGSVSLSPKVKDVSASKTDMQEEILNREVQLLAQLKQLREKVDKVANTSGGLSKPLKSVSATSESTLKQVSSSSSRDIVVFADPKHPPLWLLPAVKLLSRNGDVSTMTYVHSSVEPVPGLHCFFPEQKWDLSRSESALIVRLIWRSDLPAADLQPKVDTIRQFVRIAENSGLTGNVDEYLGIVHGLANNDVKTQQETVRSISARLEKTAFLLGEEPHLVDAVILDGLINSDLLKSADDRMKKWISACASHDLFGSMAGFLNI